MKAIQWHRTAAAVLAALLLTCTACGGKSEEPPTESVIDSVKGFEFVWITDGQGWQKAKSMIKAAYMNIPNMYNLSNIHDFIRKVKCEE